MSIFKKTLAAAALLTLTSLSAHAELVKYDFATEGDGLSLLDTNTGKEWLSLSVTDAYSFLKAS